MAAPQVKPLAQDMARIFRDLGWRVDEGAVLGVGNAPPSGTGLLVENPKDLKPAEQLLKIALETAGISFELRAESHPHFGDEMPVNVGLLFTMPVT